MITTRHVITLFIAITLIVVAYIVLTPEEDKGYTETNNDVQFEFEKP